MATATTSLPAGVRLASLTSHRDDRGSFCEIYRREWETGVEPIQWNVVESNAGVLRGVHVHVRHSDYLTVVAGRASIGLRDLRAGSPSEGLTAVVELQGRERQGISIPAGVAHGFLFHEPSVHVYAVTHYWDMSDELGCHWADPELAIPWPFQPKHVSDRDAGAGSLAELMEALAPSQPVGSAGGSAPPPGPG